MGLIDVAAIARSDVARIQRCAHRNWPRRSIERTIESPARLITATIITEPGELANMLNVLVAVSMALTTARNANGKSRNMARRPEVQERCHEPPTGKCCCSA